MISQTHNATAPERVPHEARGSRGAVTLGLIAQRDHTTVEDLEVVAAAARAHEPRVKTAVFKDRRQSVRRAWLARRPSVFFSSCPLRRFAPSRGRVIGGAPILKSEECRRLQEAGFRIPRTAILTKDHKPDVSDYGPYVVVKHDGGRRGAGVKIVRSGRIRWKPPEVESEVIPDYSNLLVQEFIYTGQWPVSYRVQTMFGEALACVKIEASRDRLPLSDRFSFREESGRCIVASSRGCSLSLVEDEEMIEIAERAHSLFPECAQLGVDLIREVPSGKVYVVEVNSRGGIWMLSSHWLDAACSRRVADQRDGLRRAGRLLADAALRLAE